jgi:hypothetical protein
MKHATIIFYQITHLLSKSPISTLVIIATVAGQYIGLWPVTIVMALVNSTATYVKAVVIFGPNIHVTAAKEQDKEEYHHTLVLIAMEQEVMRPARWTHIGYHVILAREME